MLKSQEGMTGGELFAFPMTYGSNLDLKDECCDVEGNPLSLDQDIYPNYDIILCVSTYSATAPLTAKCKEFGFRGATLHGVNDVILNSGLAVDYHEVSADAEKMRAAMTNADTIEIDFALEDGRVLTASLDLNGQDAQKSHGLCQGTTPDVANLPAGEVYFVPVDANGQFPMKYEDGTLGVLDVENRNIVRSTLIEGDQATIDAHNARLADDPMTGTLGELGFGQSGHERLPRYLEDGNSTSRHLVLWVSASDYRSVTTFVELLTFLIEVHIRRLTVSDFDRATIDVSGYVSKVLQYLEREVVHIANLAAGLFLVLEALL